VDADDQISVLCEAGPGGRIKSDAEGVPSETSSNIPEEEFFERPTAALYKSSPLPEPVTDDETSSQKETVVDGEPIVGEIEEEIDVEDQHQDEITGQIAEKMSFIPYTQAEQEISFKVGEKSYWFTTKGMTYKNAKEYCIKEGGKLPEIKDPAANAEILKQLNDNKPEFFYRTIIFWIAATWKNEKLVFDDEKADVIPPPQTSYKFPPSDCYESNTAVYNTYLYKVKGPSGESTGYDGRLATYVENGRWINSNIDVNSYTNVGYLCEFEKCPIH